jgi:sugar phosphate isomerase/epimerase
MRLGAPVFVKQGLQDADFEAQALAHVRKGYRAAYCPEGVSLADPAGIRAAAAAYQKHDVLIAEVGVWRNPLDPDPVKAKAARNYAIERLALADALGARCCVNTLGTSNPDDWAGMAADGYSRDFFDRCVQCYRDVIDAVKPTRTKMTFETMPYYFLDGPDEYIRFLKAVDRPAAGVHLDITNCINSPRRYFDSASFIEDTFKKLGGIAASCHLKDIRMYDEGFVVQFHEVPAGNGGFDMGRVLSCAAAYGDPDLPVMLEHLEDEDQYDRAYKHVESLLK